jgi:hypothetical protein
MIFVQTILLKVALDNRPPTGMRAGLEHAPFSAHGREGVLQQMLAGKRPYQFWQWPTSRPYVSGLVHYLRGGKCANRSAGSTDTTSSFSTSPSASSLSTYLYSSLQSRNQQHTSTYWVMSAWPSKPLSRYHRYSRIIKQDPVRVSGCPSSSIGC